MFSEDTNFIAQSNNDVFAIEIKKIVNDDTFHTSRLVCVNYFLSDEEVKDLQTLCECHLRNKANRE